MPILRSQEKWFFDSLRKQKFDPLEFEIVEAKPCRDGSHYPALVHKPTGYYLAFIKGSTSSMFQVEYSPGSDQIVQQWGWGAAPWDSIVPHAFTEWLGFLQREIETPDVWAELRNQNALYTGENIESLNTPFTAEEQAEIRKQLDALPEKIQEAGIVLTTEQFDAFKADIEFLKEAAGRQRRVDWRNNLVGALLSLALQHVVPVEAIQHAFGYLTTTIGHFLGLGGGPGLPPGDGGGGGYDAM